MPPDLPTYLIIAVDAHCHLILIHDLVLRDIPERIVATTRVSSDVYTRTPPWEIRHVFMYLPTVCILQGRGVSAIH